MSWRAASRLVGHVGEAERNGLMLEDGLAEGVTLVRVPHGDLEGRAGHADALGGDADASSFKVGEGDAIALAFLAQSVRRRHDHILEQISQVSEAFCPIFFSMRVTL